VVVAAGAMVVVVAVRWPLEISEARKDTLADRLQLTVGTRPV
jgi:hypothetical protein